MSGTKEFRKPEAENIKNNLTQRLKLGWSG